MSAIKNALRLLHSIHICHCDIKPKNLMWSPTYNKYVLIDFGLSKFVKENVGFKTFTAFVGTYRYASPELKKLFVLKTSSKVDLYYNDLCGLI